MKLEKILKLPMYNCRVHLVVTDQLTDEVNRLYKKRKLAGDFEDDAEAVMLSFDMLAYYIIIDLTHLSHNTIAHEVHHLVVRIAEDRNIADDEAGAWLSGHISGGIYQFLDKKKLEIHHGD